MKLDCKHKEAASSTSTKEWEVTIEKSSSKCQLWIDYFNGIESKYTNSLDLLLSADTVLMGDIILTELLQGFDSDKEFLLVKHALDPLDCVHIGGKPLAIQAASNFRFLRSRGITIRKTADMLIATWCIEHQVDLLHNDRDFDHIATLLPLQIYQG